MVSRSMKRSVEEKIEALQYLANRYNADEFKEETIWPLYGDERDLSSFREVVIETVRIWKEALEARFETEGTVFETSLCEQECSGQRKNCQYFSSYEKAWEYLLKEKQEYLDDEDLKYVKTFASIERIKMDFPHVEVHYGIFSGEWKKPEEPWRIHMFASLEMYIEERADFDYTDGDPYWDDVLGFSFCTDEELPENEQVLKLIRAVRKGEMDFYTLLHKFGRGELKQMLKWF